MDLRVVVVHPDLLGTYGDGGNAIVLTQRARWRGIDAELVEAPSDRPLPEGDLYCLGGGEDAAQVASAERLRDDGVLARAVGNGVPVLAVCAGYQTMGETFPGSDGQPLPGLGLLDVKTARGPGRRSVGEILAEPLDGSLPVLTGFENHGGLTTLGADVAPLARVISGVGNGDGTEGAIVGKIVGTYLHGPVLARNPALADLLLAWATGEPLAPLDDAEEDALRDERFAAARSSSRRVPRDAWRRRWSQWSRAGRS